MTSSLVRSLQTGVALLLFGSTAAIAAPSCTSSGAERVNVGDHRIWIETAGAGTPTVVFDSGSGADSSSFSKVASEARWKARVRTVVYDRSGQGKSEPKPAASTADDAAVLQRALELCGVRGPVVVVAQGDGGATAAQLAANNKRIAGVVLVNGKWSGAATVPVIVAEQASSPDMVVDAVSRMVEKVRADM